MKRFFFLLLLISPFIIKGQIISTVAGNGFAGYYGDGGSANSAELYNPSYCAFDVSGNLYIADQTTHLIRKVNTSGIISTYAGSYITSFGAGGYGGDGGPATAALLNYPHGIAVDHLGNLYIADQQNFRVRKVNTSGIITTYAGTGVSGFSGDGGPATAAKFHNIWGIALDDTGNLYITDLSDRRVRKVNNLGIVTTIAGTGAYGYTGDGGPATAATFAAPIDVAVDHAGNLYIADELDNCIRKINTAGIITTYAGNGIVGFSGDGGPATAAQMHWPTGVSIDKSSGPNSGYLYISDDANGMIRQVSTSGIINTIAGTGAFGYNGDGILGTLAKLYSPIGNAVDATGSVYIADAANNRVRKIYNGFIIAALPDTSVCLGTPVTFVTAPTPGCTTPTYQWIVNGSPVSAASSYTYTPSNGDSVRCVRICSGGLPESSNTIHMAVSSAVVPTIAITSSVSGTICAGTLVTFSSASTYVGSLPVYQWKVNGVTVGSGSSYTYAPANGDSIRCILNSSLSCAVPPIVSSTSIYMTVTGISTIPTVSINAIPGSSVCAGLPVTFTATATSGGTTPFYQWKVNGINAGTGGFSFTYIPVNHDSVTCRLTSSLSCLTTSSVNSNSIVITTDTFTTPSISISGPVGTTAGSIVPLTAVVANAGSSYVIKWMNYGVVFSTTTVPNTTYIKTTGTDVLTAKVSSTSSGCYDTTTSGIILVQVFTTTGTKRVTKPVVQIYPLPTHSVLTVECTDKITKIDISNLVGQRVYIQGYNSDRVDLDVSNFPPGVYFIKINETEIRRFIKE